MEAPRRHMENLDETEETVDCIQSSLETHLRFPSADKEEVAMLRSRIDEQSTLICILNQRADDLLVKYQAMQKINSEMEDKLEDCQEELDNQKQQNKILESRFMDLADNNQAIIAIMEEYKVKNKQLQTENDTLFCQKLQDKEAVVENLKLEIQQLTNKYSSKEMECRETSAAYQEKLLEQASQHKARETSLLCQLNEAQKEQKNTADMCNELKLKVQNAEDCVVTTSERFRNLTKEKETLLSLSVERGKAIEENQEEIQQLRKKLNKERNARIKAEERFKQEAETVNADIKVESLQCALDESKTKYKELMKDFEAYRNHSTYRLKQEMELNTKLRHMNG